MRILIAAPLRQDTDIFLAYQKSLDDLIIPDGVQVDRFFVVNDCPEAVPLIKGEYRVLNSGDIYTKTENDHIWTPYNLAKMSVLRNACIEKALGYDYMFSVDTDLILHPETLKTLIEADKDIVSEIFFTNNWCNAWMYDQYSDIKAEWYKPGLYQVGMTGACTLMKTKVFKAGVNYSSIPNLTIRGEDRFFCIRAACAGFELWVDTHYPATHLYTRAEFEKWRSKNEYKLSRNDG